MNTCVHSLKPYIANLPVISAHEHHHEDAWYKDCDLDRIILNSYSNWMFRQKTIRPEEREGLLNRYRSNSYLVWFERGLQQIYGCDKLSAKNWDAISQQIRTAHQRSSQWSIEILKQFGHYRSAIQDSCWKPGDAIGHPEFFRTAYRINHFVICHHADMTDHNGNSPWHTDGFDGQNFDDYLPFVEQRLAQAKANGSVALKASVAYERAIDFKPRTRAEASAIFGKHPLEVTPEKTRIYQDFMFGFCCELAAKYDLPFQNHTGLGQLGGSHPMYLREMIEHHPATKFVLLHAGYPWIGEAGALAHNYGNVYPDLTWVPLISTTAAIRAIREFLEIASEDALCWGGDAQTGEESVGGALALKHALTVALSQLVDEGYFAITDAQRVARKICHENATRVYQL